MLHIIIIIFIIVYYNIYTYTVCIGSTIRIVTCYVRLLYDNILYYKCIIDMDVWRRETRLVKIFSHYILLCYV